MIEIFSSIVALIGSVVLSGLLFLISLLIASLLPLVSSCLFVTVLILVLVLVLIPLFVVKIRPVVSIVVICHFQSLLKHYFALKFLFYERKKEEP
jgi:hypothetical protein